MTSTDTMMKPGGGLMEGGQQVGGNGPAGQQPPGTMPAQQQKQGLPPTGLQQQLQSINELYQQVQNAQGALGKNIGFDPRQMQFNAGQQELRGQGLSGGAGENLGSTSLDQMAKNMAQRYGMPIGRGRLVDENGNFLMSPQQLADASGGAVTLGEAAAQMNYISQALMDEKRSKERAKAVGALQTGIGLVQSRAPGSLAALQMNVYGQLADQYNQVANNDFEAQDFSYFIQKEKFQIEAELLRRQEKMMKKQARSQMFAGIGMAIGGIATGNIGMVAGGAGMAAGGAAGSGWF